MKAFRFPFPGNRAACAFQYLELSGPDDLRGNISLKIPGRREEAIRNREGLLQLSRGAEAMCECEQVHGARLIINPEPTGIAGACLPEADGMASDRKGLALLIKTADCQPVMLSARDGSAIMALHVGWRGNRAGFIGKAIAAFSEAFGVAPRDILAVRGPSLGPASAEFVNFEAEWGEQFAPFYDAATRRLNLWGLTKFQLREAGLAPENIHGLDACTFANPRAFFSWRRDKSAGRQGSLIWLEK